MRRTTVRQPLSSRPTVRAELNEPKRSPARVRAPERKSVGARPAVVVAQSRRCALLALPEVLVRKILRLLDRLEVCALAGVSKGMRDAAESDTLWAVLDPDASADGLNIKKWFLATWVQDTRAQQTSALSKYFARRTRVENTISAFHRLCDRDQLGDLRFVAVVGGQRLPCTARSEAGSSRVLVSVKLRPSIALRDYMRGHLSLEVHVPKVCFAGTLLSVAVRPETLRLVSRDAANGTSAFNAGSGVLFGIMSDGAREFKFSSSGPTEPVFVLWFCDSRLPACRCMRASQLSFRLRRCSPPRLLPRC